jgi:hypothetical protein
VGFKRKFVFRLLRIVYNGIGGGKNQTPHWKSRPEEKKWINLKNRGNGSIRV